MCLACIFAMYPSTLKMTKPATKLVMQLIVLSRNRRDQTHEDMAREGSPCEDGVLVAVVVELVIDLALVFSVYHNTYAMRATTVE